jgi:hypothetical protein
MLKSLNVLLLIIKVLITVLLAKSCKILYTKKRLIYKLLGSTPLICRIQTDLSAL